MRKRHLRAEIVRAIRRAGFKFEDRIDFAQARCSSCTARLLGPQLPRISSQPAVRPSSVVSATRSFGPGRARPEHLPLRLRAWITAHQDTDELKSKLGRHRSNWQAQRPSPTSAKQQNLAASIFFDADVCKAVPTGSRQNPMPSRPVQNRSAGRDPGSARRPPTETRNSAAIELSTRPQNQGFSGVLRLARRREDRNSTALL